MENIFVTGNVRSGTTLLEKILSNHKEISLMSQPFPYVYIDAKQKFLDFTNYEYTYHPLSNYFLEDKYTIGEFTKFLTGDFFDKDFLISSFDSMLAYSGQLTRFDGYKSKLEDFKNANFLNVFKKLHSVFSSNLTEKTLYLGSKDVLCEEFAPFLVNNGVKTIIAIRDPRAMIASMNYGKSGDWVGESRPTLFNLRNWRKSVAFSLYLENHANFLWIKYEDLVVNFDTTLKKITEFLGINDFDQDDFKDGIYDQNGSLWSGNSSHNKKNNISKSSINKYKNILGEDTRKYIEAICLAELKLLRYDLEFSENSFNQQKLIEEFTEPFEVNRDEFEAEYSNSSKNINNEITRLELFKQKNVNKKDIEQYFLFKDVYLKLQQTFN